MPVKKRKPRRRVKKAVAKARDRKDPGFKIVKVTKVGFGELEVVVRVSLLNVLKKAVAAAVAGIAKRKARKAK